MSSPDGVVTDQLRSMARDFGDLGELWLRVPGRMRQCYRDAEATAATWRDGWLGVAGAHQVSAPAVHHPLVDARSAKQN